jgi:hypothetical protein
MNKPYSSFKVFNSWLLVLEEDEAANVEYKLFFWLLVEMEEIARWPII